MHDVNVRRWRESIKHGHVIVKCSAKWQVYCLQFSFVLFHWFIWRREMDILKIEPRRFSPRFSTAVGSCSALHAEYCSALMTFPTYRRKKLQLPYPPIPIPPFILTRPAAVTPEKRTQRVSPARAHLTRAVQARATSEKRRGQLPGAEIGRRSKEKEKHRGGKKINACIRHKHKTRILRSRARYR